ncbi:nucleotidyltransferase family protein [Pseudopontixanthobacter vadosimaris]|uniref:nucleotidyltransferase family protein n=1 Tax=Pseudopontixanthobacter vadosimaris TaxID=2726450 RepID=UPI0014766F5A|nr:NTP transferase domain-containing protein [Pseudopontixanthobacter vadosimaris]
MRADILPVVLAAGRGRRFGGGKLDAVCAGQRVGSHVLAAIAKAGIAPGVIVVAPDMPAFAKAATHWRKAVNERAECGLGSSLALAAQIASRDGNPAMLVMLADMPLLSPAYLVTLSACPTPAATRYPSGAPGVPAVLPASLYPRLMQLDGDKGATSLLADRNDLTLCEPPPDMLTDVDRPDDLARAARLLRCREARR